MTFLAQMTSKSLLKLQQSQLTYQLTLNINKANIIKKDISERTMYWDEDTMGDLEKDGYYQWLQQQSEMFEQQQNAINDQLDLLNAEISSLEKLVSNGIKSSCSMPLLGGS